MSFKLSLPALSVDKRKAALARARFRAWWNGADFDEGKALAEIAEAIETEQRQAAESELFELAPPADDARLDALAKIWGEGRIMPGDEFEESTLPAVLSASATSAVAVFGPGLSAPVAAIAGAHPGKLALFEWREETYVALKRGVAVLGVLGRTDVTKIDLETFAAKAESFDALASFDEISFADNLQRFLQQALKSLKPGATAVFDGYCGSPGPDAAQAFASSFLEPHLRMRQDVLDIAEACGFAVVDEHDLTEAHIDLARAGFRRLAGRLAENPQVEPGVARELAWESQAWRSRVKLLAEKRLERRRFVATRRV